jgi:hypothetical protein
MYLLDSKTHLTGGIADGQDRFLLIKQHLTGYSRFLILNMHLTGRIAPTREFLMLENSVLDGLSQKSKPNTYS